MSNNIKKLREFRGMSQRQLANRLNLSDSAVSRLESGHRRLDSKIASKVAKILNFDVYEVMDIEMGEAITGEQQVQVEGNIGLDTWTTPGNSPTDEFLPVIPSGQFAALGHFAYAMTDNHAQDITSTGGYVIAVPYDSARPSPTDGDVVITRRVEGRMQNFVIGTVRSSPSIGDQVLIGGETFDVNDATIIYGLITATYRQVL